MPPCAVIRDVMPDLEGAKRGHDPLSEWIHLGAGATGTGHSSPTCSSFGRHQVFGGITERTSLGQSQTAKIV